MSPHFDRAASEVQVDMLSSVATERKMAMSIEQKAIIRDAAMAASQNRKDDGRI